MDIANVCALKQMFNTFSMFCILLNKGSSFSLILMWSKIDYRSFVGLSLQSKQWPFI